MSTLSQPSLPTFGRQLEPRIDHVFAPLCIALPQGQLSQLRERVHLHVQETRQALARNEFLDIEMVERAADILDTLLDRYKTYSEPHRALIVGAARYFTEMDDADPDTKSLLGFDDDVAVLNFVLDTIGMGALKIEL